MRSRWPNVKLGEVLTERREVPSDDDLSSGRIRIVEKIGFNDGRIQLRSDPQTRTGMILIRPGDLVISGINAAKGAIAVYEENSTQPVAATIHYGAYAPKKGLANIRFLWWMLRSRFFRELLFEYVPGGIKTELKAKRLLPIPIPLPSLAEQQRLTAQIEVLAAQIREAGALRRLAGQETEALVVSTHLTLAGRRTRKIAGILTLDECEVRVTPVEQYPQVGMRSFGGGLFPKASISGSQTTYRVFNRLYDGAVVLSQVKGWEGAVAVCGSDLSGWFVSPEYRTFRCIPGEARPDYVRAIVRTEWFWGRLKNATRGVGARRERTRPEQFLALEIPMPDVGQQEAAEQIFSKVGLLKGLQLETSVQLDALMPSILDKAFRGEI